LPAVAQVLLRLGAGDQIPNMRWRPVAGRIAALEHGLATGGARFREKVRGQAERMLEAASRAYVRAFLAERRGVRRQADERVTAWMLGDDLAEGETTP